MAQIRESEPVIVLTSHFWLDVLGLFATIGRSEHARAERKAVEARNRVGLSEKPSTHRQSHEFDAHCSDVACSR